MAAEAAGIPRATATATSSTPSVTNCRISRPTEAPSTPRSTVSRFRLSALTSSRLPTFTYAISNSKPAPLDKTRRVGRISPTTASRNGTSRALRPLLDSGYSFSSRAAIAFVSDMAASSEKPSCSRPNPVRPWQPRDCSHRFRSWIVVKNSAALMAKWNSRGSTPITEYGMLSRISDCPRISCLPPKRLCQVSYISTTARGAAGVSSVSVKTRPSIAATPRLRKKPPLTCALRTACTPSGLRQR